MKNTGVVRIVDFMRFACGVVAILSLAIFVPTVRSFILDFGENYVGRNLTRPIWHERFVSWEFLFLFRISVVFFFLSFLSSFFASALTFREFLKKKISCISFDGWMHIISFFLFVILLCVFHSLIDISLRDDILFSKMLGNESYLKERYDSWSSRLVIEAVLICSYVLYGGVWRILDVVAFVFVAEGIVRIVFPLEKRRYAFVVYVVFLCFVDWHALSSAGWVTTTVNYLWPLASSMPFFVYANDIFKKKHISAIGGGDFAFFAFICH